MTGNGDDLGDGLLLFVIVIVLPTLFKIPLVANYLKLHIQGGTPS